MAYFRCLILLIYLSCSSMILPLVTLCFGAVVSTVCSALSCHHCSFCFTVVFILANKMMMIRHCFHQRPLSAKPKAQSVTQYVKHSTWVRPKLKNKIQASVVML